MFRLYNFYDLLRKEERENEREIIIINQKINFIIVCECV